MVVTLNGGLFLEADFGPRIVFLVPEYRPNRSAGIAFLCCVCNTYML
jgi:hypothetical protein